jgi:hypothetical protein
VVEIPADELRAAAVATTGRRYSSLRRWMEANRVELERELAARPNWSALAAVFAEHGLRDARDNVPSAKVAALTWLRVKRSEGWARAAPVQRAATGARPSQEGDDPTLTVSTVKRRLGRVGDEG